MHLRKCSRSVVALAVGASLALGMGALRADNVKLDGGGSLNGSVVTGSKLVTVRTATSGLIVFDRADVKQVTHGHTAAARDRLERGRRQSRAEEAQADGRGRSLDAQSPHARRAALRRRSRQIPAGPQYPAQYR